MSAFTLRARHRPGLPIGAPGSVTVDPSDSADAHSLAVASTTATDLDPGYGPRFHLGIPAGITTNTTHAGGVLTPGWYDRVHFTDRIHVGDDTLVTRSWLPDFRSDSDAAVEHRPIFIACQVADDTRHWDDVACGLGSYVMWGCDIRGSSDATRMDGGNVLLIDCRMRCWANVGDHNDALQAYGTNGPQASAVYYCDMDSRPVNRPGAPGNGSIMTGDGSAGTLRLERNRFAGGSWTCRFFAPMVFTVIENQWVAGSWLYGPVDDDGPSVYAEASGNVLSNGTPLPLG